MFLETYLTCSGNLNDRSLSLIIKSYTIIKEKGTVIGSRWLTWYLHYQKIPNNVRKDIFWGRLNPAVNNKDVPSVDQTFLSS